ncbi:hypothetical protein BGZ67_003814 [Mortierella alpina]|nr:hypothetical protein BGZ67_003814 [Mortierella alpina]
MLSIRAIAAMAFIAVVAIVSAAPAAEPVQALADFPVPDGYKFCTTRPIGYMKCWEYCVYLVSSASSSIPKFHHLLNDALVHAA